MNQAIPGLLLISGFLAGATCVDAAEPNDRVRLNNRQWQVLPARVEPAVAPDGRIWLNDFRQEWEPDLDEAKQHIAEEFDKQVPHIRSPLLTVLFEASGRVWFFWYAESLILGYDGSEWITRKIDDKLDYPSMESCPMRGALLNGSSHRAVGGQAWFLSNRGVHHFDGQAWSYQRMDGDTLPFGNGVGMAIHASGKVGVAFRSAGKARLFRDGRWTVHDVELSQVAFESPASILSVDRGRRLRRFSITDEGIESADDHRLGQWHVFGIRGLYHDPAGQLFVAGKFASDDSPDGQRRAVNGIANLDPATKAIRLIRTDEDVVAACLPYSRGGRPVITADGKHAWLPNRISQQPAMLISLESGDVVERFPYAEMKSIRGMDRDGRLVVGHRGERSRPYLIYSTDGREPPSLAASVQVCGRGPVAVTADGTLFATDPGGAITYRAGARWQEIEQPGIGRIDSMIPGRGDTILVCAHEKAVLYQGGKRVAAANLFELLEIEHERIGKAFGPDVPLLPPEQPTQLVVSRDGNIWCLSGGTLRLFTDGHWIDTTDDLKHAGARRNARHLAPIADGNRVFITDLASLHSYGKSYVVSLTAGELKFLEVSHALPRRSRKLTVADHNGGLWIASVLGRSAGTSDWITGQLTIRLTGEERMAVLKNAGYVSLVDQAGNVWLTTIRQKPVDTVYVLTGDTGRPMKIPGYAGGMLFSDRPGSVYAVTTTGLQHLVAEAPDFRDYAPAEHYVVEGINGDADIQLYSSQGFIALGMPASGGTVLRQVELPK